MVPSDINFSHKEEDIVELGKDLKRQGVKYCLAAFVDVHGIPKSKAVPIDHFERMMRGSELYTGAALDGLGQGPDDDELALYPEPAAVTVLPWRPEVAWAPGNLKYHEEPWPMCSRTILATQVKRAAEMGYRVNLGIECEIYLVTREGDKVFPANPKNVLPKAAYDTVGLLESLDWLDENVGYMNSLGWEVYSFDHEDANSQFEFDFAYSDIMTMADRFVLWRLMMKETARQRGFEATFMAKPYSNRTGNGAHFNMSFESLKTGENVFGDSLDKRGCGLSTIAYQFLAGILDHAPAVVATTCPTVNSYKRLVKTGSMTGYTWAPIFISYGGNNRTNMLRVPKLRPSIEGNDSPSDGMYLSSARIECRAVDTSMNPYLAAAMMLGAGLDGIERELDPGEPQNVNTYDLSESELNEKNIKELPKTLIEAIEAFSRDPLSQKVMGPELAQSYETLKAEEWSDYFNQITTWELDAYLTKF